MERNDLYKLFHQNSNTYPSQLQYASGEKYDSQPLRKTYSPHFGDVPVLEGSGADQEVFPTRSVRKLAGHSIRRDLLFSLLHSTYFLKQKDNKFYSTTPSAGGLYPIEMYIIIQNIDGIVPGVYYYQREHGGLHFLHEGESPLPFLPEVNQFAQQAACLFVLTAEMKNLIAKYGNRGYRYALIECGHIGQNLSLRCTDLHLGCCALGGFYDRVLEQFLNLGDTEIPLYLFAVGREG